jgi:UDP-N-acetylglucosamine 4-epimerase
MLISELYANRYHSVDLSKYRILITGGAGFIGSNLVEYFLKYNIGHIRVLDNLSNGYFENIKDFVGLHNFEFIVGDITDFATCENAVDGMDLITHQAALGSVPRSINDPITTNQVNISGFLNVLTAAKNSKKLIKMVYAASSSTYGDSPILPKTEGEEGKPLSPYAVTKLVNEIYADVFSKVYGFHTTGLRYFNVFGPKQNPNNPYAAVIPIFCKNIIENESPIINGDGETSRDFTFIENVVQANIKSLFSLNNSDINKKHNIFNVACGEQTSLNEIIQILNKISGKSISPTYGNERAGDIKHSKANIDLIKKMINYEPIVNFEKGLEYVYNYLLNRIN